MNPLMQSTGKKPRTGAVLTCPECNVDFYAPPCNVERRKYCSRTCKEKAQQKQTRKLCAVCQVEFTKARSYGAKFCSRKCYLVGRQPQKQCKVCGKSLPKSVLTYCSQQCLHEDRRNRTEKPCEICGKSMTVTPHLAESKRFCSRKCKNEGHKIQGAGATYVRVDGYIAVYYPKHPDATSGGVILQHRLVAEEKYGRRILKTEHVHHVNGIRNDNRPENLEVITSGAHALISNQQGVRKRRSIAAELEEYRRKFGPLT